MNWRVFWLAVLFIVAMLVGLFIFTTLMTVLWLFAPLGLAVTVTAILALAYVAGLAYYIGASS